MAPSKTDGSTLATRPHTALRKCGKRLAPSSTVAEFLSVLKHGEGHDENTVAATMGMGARRSAMQTVRIPSATPVSDHRAAERRPAQMLTVAPISRWPG